MKNIVNLILGLFLICSMILPMLGLVSALKTDIDIPAENSIDTKDYEDSYNDMVLSQAAKNLVTAANDLLISEGIYAKNIEVGLKKEDNNSIYISFINIYITKEYEQRAEDIIKVIGSNMSKEPVIILSE